MAEEKSVLREIVDSVSEAASRVLDGLLDTSSQESTAGAGGQSLQDQAYWEAKRSGDIRPDQNPFAR